MLKCFYCIQYSQNLPLVVRGSTSIQIAFKIKENEIMTTKLIEFSKRVLLYSFSRGYAWASPCFIFHPFSPCHCPYLILTLYHQPKKLHDISCLLPDGTLGATNITSKEFCSKVGQTGQPLMPFLPVGHAGLPMLYTSLQLHFNYFYYIVVY